MSVTSFLWMWSKFSPADGTTASKKVICILFCRTIYTFGLFEHLLLHFEMKLHSGRLPQKVPPVGCESTYCVPDGS